MLKCCRSSKNHQIFAEEKLIDGWDVGSHQHRFGKSWRALCWEQEVDSGEHHYLLALLLYSFLRNYIRTPLETGYWAFILEYWEHLFFCYCKWRRLGLHRRSVGLQSVLSYLSLASSVETEILTISVSAFGLVSTDMWSYSSYIIKKKYVVFPHSPINTPLHCWCCLRALLVLQFSGAFLYYVVRISHHSPWIKLSQFLAILLLQSSVSWHQSFSDVGENVFFF